jgi:hypothetical protein
LNSETGGVTVLVLSRKVFSKTCILELIKNLLEKGNRKEQAAVRHNMSCVDQINTLTVVIEQYLEFQCPLYMCVSCQRASGSFSRAWIWDELMVRGLTSKIINKISEDCKDFCWRVLHGGQLSGRIQTSAGVGQGCLLSPSLFVLVVGGVLRGALI